MPDTFTIAAVQMRMAPDKEPNLAKAEAAIADAAKQGAQVVCLPELFTGYYFCQKEDAALFDLAEPIPGPSSDRLAAAAKKNGVVVVGSLFEKRMPGVYHNTATVHDAERRTSSAYTARCTSPTTRSFWRSSTSRRATWASRYSTPSRRRSARSSAGISGIPRRRGSRRCRVRR